MPHTHFNEFIAHTLVTKLRVKAHGTVTGMQHHARESAARGFSFGFRHHQPSDAEALLPVVHGHLAHLDGAGLQGREQKCAPQHISLPGGQVEAGGFRAQLGLGEFQTQGLAQDVAAKDHRQCVVR